VDWLTADLGSVDVGRVVTKAGVDTVFDLAGSANAPGSLHAPLGDLAANSGQTLRILESLRGLPAPPFYVYGSSAAVYGRVSRLPIAEDDPVTPLSPYAVSKLATEQYISLYARVHGQPGISLRFFSVYGPGQRKQAIFDLIREASAAGGMLHVKAPADVTRDFVFVKDVVGAAVDLAQRAAGDGEVFNVASGRETSMDELARAILAACAVEKGVSFGQTVRPGDPHRYVGATERIASLGVHLETPLVEGLRDTAAWIHEDQHRTATPTTESPRHSGARMRPASARQDAGRRA
jgi:UDP-glucose 4-epimerase